jgi:hypothetical protein
LLCLKSCAVLAIAWNLELWLNVEFRLALSANYIEVLA